MNTPATQNETSPANRCVLPDAWVERIFERMAALHGSKFADLWGATNPENLKRVWAEKLGGFFDRPNIIKDALDACDSIPNPPTLPVFLNICRDVARRHGSYFEALPSPQLSVAERMERVEQLASVAARPAAYDYRAWAKELRSRYLAGEHLLPIQITMASEALNEVWDKGQCTQLLAAA